MASDSAYLVLWSRKAREALITMGEKAHDFGSAAALAQAATALEDKLRRNAHEVGEAYRTRGVVEERVAVHAFLAIDFAVDTAKRLVLVRDCRALSGHGI